MERSEIPVLVHVTCKELEDAQRWRFDVAVNSTVKELIALCVDRFPSDLGIVKCNSIEIEDADFDNQRVQANMDMKIVSKQKFFASFSAKSPTDIMDLDEHSSSMSSVTDHSTDNSSLALVSVSNKSNDELKSNTHAQATSDTSVIGITNLEQENRLSKTSNNNSSDRQLVVWCDEYSGMQGKSKNAGQKQKKEQQKAVQTSKKDMELGSATAGVNNNRDCAYQTNPKMGGQKLTVAIREITQKESITRHAVDSGAHLGTLYDAHMDRMLSSTSLLDKFPQFAPQRVTTTGEFVVISSAQSREDRFSALDIEKEQQASILAELCTVNGVFQNILLNDYLDANTFIIIKRDTRKEYPTSLKPDYIEHIFEEVRSQPEATHFVCGISYGSVQMLNIEYDVNDTNAAEIHQILLDRLNRRRVQDCAKTSKLRVTLVADGMSFTNFGFAMKTLEMKIDDESQPIKYKLLPIQPFVELFNNQNVRLSEWNPIGDSFISQAIATLEYLRNLACMIKNTSEAVQQYGFCMTEQEYEQVKAMMNEFTDKVQDHVRQTANVICEQRFTNFPDARMILHTKNMDTQRFTEEAMYYLRNLASYFSPKFKCVSDMAQKGIIYIGRGNTTLSEEIKKMKSRICYVLFDKDKNDLNDIQNRKLFFHYSQTEGNSCVYFNMNLAKLPAGIPNDDLRIVKYRDGEILTLDCLCEYCEKQKECLAKYDPNSCIPWKETPAGCIVLDIPCPKAKRNGGKCPDEDCRFKCDYCMQLIEVDTTPFKNWVTEQFDEDLEEDPKKTEERVKKEADNWYAHCDCGRTPLKNVKFRCAHADSHGNEFTPYSTVQLRLFLRQLTTFGEKNLLILGETGVGKSTFINAFANYLTYTTLSEALNQPPVWLIPSRFIIAGKEVKIGESDENTERLELGRSFTQSPKSYVFDYKGGKLRIIDTPGIGDPEGVTQDKLNFDKTLRLASHLKDIHGICILMRPNQVRLTPGLKYCINELLTHLHKDAARNIVFCYTRAHTCMYKSDDTQKILQDHLNTLETVKIPLNDDTTYFMDSESFRFLCASRAGVEFDQKHYAEYEESWAISQPEMLRLVRYVTSLKPHLTRQTTSLNEARRIILTLSKPMATITKIIQNNKAAIQDKLDRIKTCDMESNDLRHDLRIPHHFNVKLPLNYPRTVCTSHGCTELKDIQGSTRKEVVYKTHCHEHCYLTGVPEDTIKLIALQGCWAMQPTRTTCSVCRCPWDMHMHISYDQVERYEEIESDTVKEHLKRNASSRQLYENHIKELEERIHEYETEEEILLDIAAQFGSFLQCKSIMTINDAMQEYVEFCIDEQKRCGNLDSVKNLREFLDEYLKQKEIIVRAIKNNEKKVEEIDVAAFKEKIFALQLTGKQIKELYVAEEEARQNHIKHGDHKFDMPKVNRKSRTNQLSSRYNSALRDIPNIIDCYGDDARKCDYTYGNSQTSSFNSWSLSPSMTAEYQVPRGGSYASVAAGSSSGRSIPDKSDDMSKSQGGNFILRLFGFRH